MCDISYNTTMNTLGIGNAVPGGGENGYGSGDKFDYKSSKKKGMKPATKAPAYVAERPLIVYTKK